MSAEPPMKWTRQRLALELALELQLGLRLGAGLALAVETVPSSSSLRLVSW